MTDIRKIPIGIQSFEDLRVKNFLYVDKTSYVAQLASLNNLRDISMLPEYDAV
ncbi:AAA family ATPase [Treponema sp. OMZ 788]|uniref:AAA family ATPase n=1 Tax=Treponema sp. OMZ 788 TaxID=2563664 RepID=UPI0020A31406|nr:AAA family ATPase [Treponema sp. OMZ 788]